MVLAYSPARWLRWAVSAGLSVYGGSGRSRCSHSWCLLGEHWRSTSLRSVPGIHVRPGAASGNLNDMERKKSEMETQRVGVKANSSWLIDPFTRKVKSQKSSPFPLVLLKKHLIYLHIHMRLSFCHSIRWNMSLFLAESTDLHVQMTHCCPSKIWQEGAARRGVGTAAPGRPPSAPWWPHFSLLTTRGTLRVTNIKQRYWKLPRT